MDRGAPTPMTTDAIVVVPGIMGSVLRDAATREIVWGMQDPRLYVDAWVTGRSLERLALTDDEREGRTGRIVPDGVLTIAAWCPLLQGFEPYDRLVRRLDQVAHPDSIRAFGYDWRLSIEHNGRALEKAALDHLERWRRHPLGTPDARLILIAHSMGGLVARWFTHVLGGAQHVRTTVTLGTPFHGSVKAAIMIAEGSGAPAPLPKRRLRQMARTMPGLHDLLPFYPCVDEGDSARRLDAADVAAFGGDRELAIDAIARHERLALDDEPGERRLIVGTTQPTWQSLTLDAGTVTGQHYEMRVTENGGVIRVDRAGDGTVYRGSAGAFGLSARAIGQTHGALARTKESIDQIHDIVLGDEMGPPLGAEGGIGLDIGDLVEVGRPATIRLTGIEPTAVGITVHDVADGHEIASPSPYIADGEVRADAYFAQPGLYRVSVHAGAASPVTQQILVIPPGATQ